MPCDVRGWSMTDPRMQLEESFASKVFSALATWLAKVRQAVMSAWKVHRLRPDPLAIQATKPIWIRLVDGLQEELRRAADLGFSEVANQAAPKNEQLIEQSLAASYHLMVGIPDEVQQEIQKEINDAVNAGDSPDRIAARVDALLDANGSQRWRNRARTIAATEIHRSANSGVQAAGMAISRLESVRLNKKWVTRHDNRVRITHVAADRQVVPLNSLFTVGTSRMLTPGDPTAPPEEVINCRCSMSIEDAT